MIQNIDLFPFEEDISIIKQKAAAIESFDGQLKSCVAELLLITMRCIYLRYQQLKDQTSYLSPSPSGKYLDVRLVIWFNVLMTVLTKYINNNICFL
jgi:hypothetical protein